MITDPDDRSLLYEVEFEADADIGGPFDTWLRDHVADVLQLPGFQRAEILEEDAATAGRLRRTVQYRLQDAAALESFRSTGQDAIEAQGSERFGERVHLRRRVLAHREEFRRGAVTENCLNCGEVLTGQHCAHCGQRARVRVLSLWGLVRDMLGDVLDWDARVWRTLRPLAFRPGLLTIEFLRGRRAAYTPPFRMYLVLSLLFFLVTSAGNDLDIRVGGEGNGLPLAGGTVTEGVEPAPPAAPEAPGSPPAGALDPERQKLLEAVVSKLPEEQRSAARTELQREFVDIAPENVASLQSLASDPCSAGNLKVEVGPLGEKYGPRLREACTKIVDDAQGFGSALYQNIPKMMFIFLPLVAAIMWLLYLGSGRYYVEHLLFFVHYHAFFFLGGLVIVLLERIGAALKDYPVGETLTDLGGLSIAVFIFYWPYYLYRAMRRVYGQGRGVTLLKYGLLAVGYMQCMILTGLGLLAYTALSL